MSIRSHSLPPALILLAAAMVLLGTLYFASLRPGYSHISNTISELGETGGPRARLVAYGFFLPVGLLVCLALWLLQRERPDKEASPILLALSQAAVFVVAGASCLVSLVLLLPVFYIRGGVQRVAEVIQFGGVFFACLLLSKQLPPDQWSHWTPGRA